MLADFIFTFSNHFILIIPYLKGGEGMRPRRYPYSGKKESTFVKADPELMLNINKIDVGNIQAKNIFGKI